MTYISNKSFIDNLVIGIKAYPIIYVPHYDISYLREALEEVVSEKYLGISFFKKVNKLGVCYCNMYESLESNAKKIFVENIDGESVEHVEFPNGLYEALIRITRQCCSENKTTEFQHYSVFVFENILEELKKPEIRYALGQFIHNYNLGKMSPEKTLVIIDPHEPSSIPNEIAQYINIIDIPYPSNNTSDIGMMIDAYLKESKRWDKTNKIKEIRDNLIQNLQGLSYFEINSLLRTISFVTNGYLNESCLSIALKEKQRLVQKTGVLEVWNSNIMLEDVGGLENLKKEIIDKKIYFENLAKVNKAALSYPKGLLIIGMPGCGKSMIAKAIASYYNITLLRLDVGNLLGKHYGESEENLKKALRMAEICSPCVLWMDEVEKAFAGADGKTHPDALLMRVMGQFLTWQQERESPVYVVATANDAMRSEFMRKGRFDEVFFVDFPNREETKEILKNKIKKYEKEHQFYNFEDFNKDIESIASDMCNSKVRLSGAEIECAVKLAMESFFKQYIEEENKLKELNINDCVKPVVIKYNKTFQEIVEDMTLHAMYCSTSNSKEDSESTPIDRIRLLETKYHLKHASKN